jgi:hypothetical protein
MDGRQDVRAALYARGPGAPWDARAVIAELQEADLYPHGVHVVHEGDTDEQLIVTLIGSLIGSMALEEVNFTDLRGAGNAAVVADLVRSLDGYVRRTVVVLDNEANARSHVEAMLAEGNMPADDALLFDTSLEEANASLDELVELAKHVASEHGVSLSVTPDEVRVFHDAAVARSATKGREAPSLSTSLERVIRRETGGAWCLRKRQLVAALADHLARDAAGGDPSESTRPIVRFVVERIIPPLNRAYPLGAS